MEVVEEFAAICHIASKLETPPPGVAGGTRYCTAAEMGMCNQVHTPDGEVETLWAFDLGGGHYRLDHLPWYAYRVSLGDVIEASPDADGQLHMVRVVRKSGQPHTALGLRWC